MHSLETIEKLNREKAQEKSRKEFAKKLSLIEKAGILFRLIIFKIF